MKWTKFADMIKGIVKPKESISILVFNWKGIEYRIYSHWGSGHDMEDANLWAKKTNPKKGEKDKVYPFSTNMIGKLKFTRKEKK